MIVSWSHNCEILEYGRSTFCKIQEPKLEVRLILTGWAFWLPEKHAIDCFGMFFDEKNITEQPMNVLAPSDLGFRDQNWTLPPLAARKFCDFETPKQRFLKGISLKNGNFFARAVAKNTFFYLQNRGFQRVNHPKTVKFSRAAGAKK